jgi:hypothetical protein
VPQPHLGYTGPTLRTFRSWAVRGTAPEQPIGVCAELGGYWGGGNVTVGYVQSVGAAAPCATTDLVKRGCASLRRLLLAVVASALLLQAPFQPGGLGTGLASSDADGEPGPLAGPISVPSTYWGAYVPGWPGSQTAVDNFELTAGKRMSIVAWGAAWWHDGGYIPFDTAAFQTIRDRGSIPLLGWGAWDYCCGVDQPKFSLASITRGDHDAFLTQWARAAHAWGHPLFLDFNSEMNGWWWPWSEQVNGNAPGDYVAAWQHVVDLFRREGATNVTWLWCPNIVESATTPLDQLYPGDDYVDWTCMDGYNWGTALGNTWQDPDQVFGTSNYRSGGSTTFDSSTYDLLQQIAPSKPIMIGETAASESGGSKADWITTTYTEALPRRFPAVKAVVWFAWVDTNPGIGWGIDSSPPTQAAFASSIALPRYAPNLYGKLESSPIHPPDGPYSGPRPEARSATP